MSSPSKRVSPAALQPLMVALTRANQQHKYFNDLLNSLLAMTDTTDPTRLHRADDGTDKEVDVMFKFHRALDSSLSLRNTLDLVIDFVDSVSANRDLSDEWRGFVETRRTAELNGITLEEGLNPGTTRQFTEHSFRDGSIPATGTATTRIFPPVSRFALERGHGETKRRVLDRLDEHFEHFLKPNCNGGDQR